MRVKVKELGEERGLAGHDRLGDSRRRPWSMVLLRQRKSEGGECERKREEKEGEKDRGERERK